MPVDMYMSTTKLVAGKNVILHKAVNPISNIY